MLSEKELAEIEARAEWHDADAKKLLLHIKYLKALIADMHVPEPAMKKVDGEWVEADVPNRFGGKL